MRVVAKLNSTPATYVATRAGIDGRPASTRRAKTA
jgi:hypothetical protein